MKRLHLIASGIIASACSCLISISCTSQPEWTLVWEDNFDNGIDTAVWSKIPRGKSDWNNYMSPFDSCYDVADGNLILRGLTNRSLDNDTAPYLTGGVYTSGKKAFDNGRLEIRARLGSARGAWPAFWLLPDAKFSPDGPESCKWPNGGEIDIMERLSYDTIAYQTVHSNYTLNLKKDNEPPHSATGAIDPDGYNIYAVELGPDSLRFFINGNHTFTYPRIETDLPDQYPYDRPMYLLLDMQLGGNWVGAVDSTDLPVEMHIDWVRFYRRQ